MPNERRPALEERNPLMLAAERLAAKHLDEWMVRRGVGNTELSEAWNISESIVRDLRDRSRPLRAGHLVLLPKRARSVLFDLLEGITPVELERELEAIREEAAARLAAA